MRKVASTSGQDYGDHEPMFADYFVRIYQCALFLIACHFVLTGMQPALPAPACLWFIDILSFNNAWQMKTVAIAKLCVRIPIKDDIK